MGVCRDGGRAAGCEPGKQVTCWAPVNSLMLGCYGGCCLWCRYHSPHSNSRCLQSDASSSSLVLLGHDINISQLQKTLTGCHPPWPLPTCLCHGPTLGLCRTRHPCCACWLPGSSSCADGALEVAHKKHRVHLPASPDVPPPLKGSTIKTPLGGLSPPRHCCLLL